MDHSTEPHTVSHRSTLIATSSLTTTAEPASTTEPLTTAANLTTKVKPSTITTAEPIKPDHKLDIFENETDCTSIHQSGGGDTPCQASNLSNVPAVRAAVIFDTVHTPTPSND